MRVAASAQSDVAAGPAGIIRRDSDMRIWPRSGRRTLHEIEPAVRLSLTSWQPLTTQCRRSVASRVSSKSPAT